MSKVIIRCTYGSHAEVVKVYAYDPWEGTALVKVRYENGKESLGRVEVGSGDVEAFHDDPGRTFADLKAELRKRAEELLPDDPFTPSGDRT